MPLLLFTVLFAYRKQIDEVMRKLKILRPPDVADCAFSVERLRKAYPKEVSHLLLSMASKFEKFQPGFFWFGVFQLLVRLLQTSLLTFFASPDVQCTFAAAIALVSVVLQRELEPYRIASDGLVAMVAQWCVCTNSATGECNTRFPFAHHTCARFATGWFSYGSVDCCCFA